jgi:hypothetical protein
MAAMENELRLPILRTFPVQLTRYLCGKSVASALALPRRVGIVSRIVFLTGLGAIRAFDAIVRLFVPQFSISRMLTRVLGYRITWRILMDQTRPLKLPDKLLHDVNTALAHWQDDPESPRWLAKIEATLAGRKPQ